MIRKQSLKKVRKKLKQCLAAKHIETDASIKKCLIEAISELDREIENDETQLDHYLVLKMLGKILDKLPWIVSLFEKLK